MVWRSTRTGSSGLCVTLCVLLFWSNCVRSYPIFVSPNGHDVHGDGSEWKPFQSVQAAVDSAWEYDVIFLMSGVHSSDNDIRFHGKKLAVRAHNPPVTRTGGCWPVHTGDPEHPTLTRCNISSWPQSWNRTDNDDGDALSTRATSVQTWPKSFEDRGRTDAFFHGFTKKPIPSSEGGDYWDPGDHPRGNPDDYICGDLGCDPQFHGSGNLQATINSDATLVGARFLFFDGDEAILRDLDVRGSLDGAGSSRSWDSADEGGCLFVSGNANITVVDSSFAFCRALGGGGAASVGYQSNVWFSGVRFLNNSASRGGAVFASMEGDVRFEKCEFSGNEADRGGAVYANDLASPRLEESDFFANRASIGGAVLAEGDAAVALGDCALFHNAAERGGAVAAAEAGRVALANCTLQNNSAAAQGGGILVERGAAAAATDSALLFNSAPHGGALWSAAPGRRVEVAGTLFAFNAASNAAAHIHPHAQAAAVGAGGGNTVCSGRGLVEEGAGLRCVCAEGAEGPGEECGVRCPGAEGGGGGPCSGHGVCTGDSSRRDRRCRWLPGRRWVCVEEVEGLCRCDFGFTGSACDQHCPGHEAPGGGRLGRRGVCSGHGECVLMNGTAGCECEFGWGGAGCDELRLYALGCGGGPGAEDNRVVRLGDRVLVNSREPGLHVVALNRSDLSVVWDRSYDVGARGGGSAAAGFYPEGDIDGTVNVAEGRASEGAEGSLDAGEGGALSRNPQASPRFFGEEAANRMARDLSLFDARHLLVVTSFASWENHTNPALVQALRRVGGPDLAGFARGGAGAGHSLVVIGVPDAEEQLADAGGLLEGSYVVSRPGGAPQCGAEVEVNLRRREEVAEVRWCGGRLVRGGVDVSHLEGTGCDDGGTAYAPAWFSAAGHGAACAGGNCSNASAAAPRNSSLLNATLNASSAGESAPGCNATRLAVLCNASNASASACAHGSDAPECLCVRNLSQACSDAPRVHRWVVVPRTAAGGHHPDGQQLEGWDLDSDFDASAGPEPVLVSRRTVLQPCCNRSARWRHGGCRRGRSVAPAPGDPSRLVCFESGWEAGGGFAGVFGNIDAAGARWNTLGSHSPPRDQLPGASSFGAYTPYLPDPGNRLRPFSLADIVPVLEDPEKSYGQQGYYAETRSRATPTPVFKRCEPGIGECLEGVRGGLVVDGECALGQCGRSTGEQEQQRWERTLD